MGFEPQELADELERLGFRGQLLLGGEFGQGMVELPEERWGLYGYSVGRLDPFPGTCAAPNCRPDAGHQCLPGPPDLVAAEVVRKR
mmetsp:Transcript_101801/g.328530  ORF Transcript_101801/g.328530 Transcript_101801/m.328530 type:complete len:86 (-) Transcript_101801:38-295(-)